MKSVCLLISTLILVVSLSACVGVGAALDGMVPVSDAQMQNAMEEQAEAQGKAVESASEGNSVNAVLYSIIAALTGSGIVVGASKRRRGLAIAKAKVEKAQA